MLERPEWIRARAAWDSDEGGVRDLLRELRLHSVCVEAACPNRGECWASGHVTFLIMGDKCTRNCLFCNVSSAEPVECDSLEPENVGLAVEKLGAVYAVITSVTRDDLEDKGAGHFTATVSRIKSRRPDVLVELLIPDLGADKTLIGMVASSGASVIGHNIEIPRGLYGAARPGADYDRSLEVLKTLSSLRDGGPPFLVKSSMILGLGEDEGQVLETLRDLKKAGTDIVYMGQYLRPTERHWPVKKYYTPGEFDELGRTAGEMGFKAVLSGPMVRSSYRAFGAYKKAKAAGLSTLLT